MISIITPVLNEEENISTFLTNLNQIKGDFELLLIDGGSTDKTIDEINKNKNKFKRELKVLKTSPGRGHQMNIGASNSKGDILLFLHVDSKIDKDTVVAIENEIKKQKIIGGGLSHSFSDSDNFLKLASNFGNFRTKITKIFFGDFGIFVRKDIFEKIGGYDEIIFLEDLKFSKKLKKYGKLKQLDITIITSPRRYIGIGKIKLTIIFTIACFLNIVGYRPIFLKKFIVDK
jgi:rSAM/selenodomain-associated transferase 2